jgi:protein-tyrosine phosphatase
VDVVNRRFDFTARRAPNVADVIDLHCHMLPGIDDGSPDLAMSLAMAEMAVADGITVTACTPHILPGVYANTGAALAQAVEALTQALNEADIPLAVTTGADVHVAPNLLGDIRAGKVLTLGGSRYLLLEPPHHVLPPRLEDLAFGLAAGGIVPIVTHPERLKWIETHYELVQRMAARGILMQVTAGSILGKFGSRARYWAERMLDEGIVDILASDAHDVMRRPPLLSEARDAVAKRHGHETANRLVVTNPLYILKNMVASELRRP